MTLTTSFVTLLQPFALAMTLPTFTNLVLLLPGWLFARRRTITAIIVAAGLQQRRHHSAFHRIFAAGVWCRDQVGLGIFTLIRPLLRGTIFVALDDTLARKRGLKIFGVSMHHDPLLSSRKKAITNWGHSWVVLGVLLPCPLGSRRVFCLPILFRLYLSQHQAHKAGRLPRSRPDLAVQLLEILCRAYPELCFHAVADSHYGGRSVLGRLPSNCQLTSRLVLDARLHSLVPPRAPGSKGRPRKRGERLPTPEQMLAGRCRRRQLAIYGRQDKVRLADQVGCAYHVPDRLLRVVAVEPLSGGRPKQAFYSTDHAATSEQILVWYAHRWSLEVAFHDSKGCLGFEEPQSWSRPAVERLAPVAMWLYSLVVLWFVQEGQRHYQAAERPWYRQKVHPSFADMLATLKYQSLEQSFFARADPNQGCENVTKTRKILQQLLC
jgi:hypothetical protein